MLRNIDTHPCQGDRHCRHPLHMDRRPSSGEVAGRTVLAVLLALAVLALLLVLVAAGQQGPAELCANMPSLDGCTGWVAP